MKLLKLRQRLFKVGLTLLETKQGFTVTDSGSKTPIEETFPDREAVERWLTSKELHDNRLNDEEADEFDEDWARFVMETNDEEAKTKTTQAKDAAGDTCP